jgi:hypothetical protein
MFSFPFVSTSKSKAHTGGTDSDSSVHKTQRVWEVDPLDKTEDPVLQALGLLVSYYAYQRPATLHFEPWLKHGCAIFVQEGSELQETVGFSRLVAPALKPLIKDICGLDGIVVRGSGALYVRGHKFSLLAEPLPSPWGERLVLDARHEGDMLSDPISVFPWIADYMHFVVRQVIDVTDQLIVSGRYPTRIEERVGAVRKWLTGVASQRTTPAIARRIEILGNVRNFETDVVRLLIRDKLRDATEVGAAQVHLVVSNKEIRFYQQCRGGSVGLMPDGLWNVRRGAARLRGVIADWGSRYPAEVAVEDSAVGIAFAVGGHPVDVIIKETQVQGSARDEVSSNIKDDATRADIMFTITIHDDSPEPPHREVYRRLAEESRARGEEEPPSELYSDFMSFECYDGATPPRRSWHGWFCRRLGGTGRAQAGDMTLEDAQEVASFLKAKHYEKALARALPFKSEGPEVAMGIVPPCVVGLLGMLLGRYREARASICDYQMRVGEDLVSTLLLAECCERLGDTGASEKAMRRALELSLKPVSRLVANGELLEDHGLLEQAVFLYKVTLSQEAIARHGELALENERKYSPCGRDAHPRRLAWPYAQLAADHAVAEEGVDTYLMPTKYGCAHEKKTREHGGLYWQDIEQSDGRRIRQYFPNYLNRFASKFQPDSTAVEKLGPLLNQLGRSEEADVFLFEAQFL